LFVLHTDECCFYNRSSILTPRGVVILAGSRQQIFATAQQFFVVAQEFLAYSGVVQFVLNLPATSLRGEYLSTFIKINKAP